MYSQMEDRDDLSRIRAVTLDRNSMLLQRRSDSPRDHATGERKYQRRSKLEDSGEEAPAIYPMVRCCVFVCARVHSGENERDLCFDKALAKGFVERCGLFAVE